jgi:hypothetical protein
MNPDDAVGGTVVEYRLAHGLEGEFQESPTDLSVPALESRCARAAGRMAVIRLGLRARSLESGGLVGPSRQVRRRPGPTRQPQSHRAADHSLDRAAVARILRVATPALSLSQRFGLPNEDSGHEGPESSKPCGRTTATSCRPCRPCRRRHRGRPRARACQRRSPRSSAAVPRWTRRSATRSASPSRGR